MADKKLVEAITSRDVDFAQWYTDIVLKAELIDYTSVKGCMVIRPEGYALWVSRMERRLADAVEALKHTETIEELTDLNNAVFFIEEIAAKLPSDQPDAIEGVTVKSDVRSHGIFNLQGVRMNGEQLPAGLYIINGKKVVIN